MISEGTRQARAGLAMMTSPSKLGPNVRVYADMTSGKGSIYGLPAPLVITGFYRPRTRAQVSC